MKFDAKTYRMTDSGSWGKSALVLGVVGIIAIAAGFFVDSKQFFFSYLTAYTFFLTLALGGLFFTMLHHLVGATWSVVMRRISETVMYVLPPLAILFLPIAFGLHDLYHWSHPDVVAADELLQEKQAYLNAGFFFVRAAVYFISWILLAWSLYKTSLRQDAGHTEAQAKRMRKISAGGMVLFAFTVTFASFDWLMSLEAHWYSTIFGAYVFSGAVMGALAFMTAMAILLPRRGVLENVITVEHWHDLAKLTFAFAIFWAYMAFSQYLLIWYANVPEETIWFQHRWVGSWKIVSLIIVFGHFVIPFFFLITRAAKRKFGPLLFVSLWLVLMHWVDIYWVIMPAFSEENARLSWMDPAALLGIGGLAFWYFWRRLSSNPLVPVSDPALADSIRFTNM